MKKKTIKIKKLILHIGAQKTGTSAIQSFLFKNKEVINRHGFYMPVFLYNDEHKPKALRVSIVQKKSEKTRDYLEGIATRAREALCDTVIISDENYCKIEHIDFENVRVFAEYFDEIVILLYCRRHDRELESRYAFQVMWEGSKLSDDPDQWFRKGKGRDYFAIAKYYENQIKGCRIKLVSYDLNSTCLINSFIDACEMPQHHYIMPDKSESNITDNKYVVEVMSRINQYFMSDGMFKKVKECVLSHPSLKKGPKALFYSNKQRKHLERLFYSSTRALVEKYNNGGPVFDDLKPISVPKGLDKQVKNDIIKETVQHFGLRYCKSPDAMIRLKKRLRMGSEILLVDIYREIAIVCEELHLYGSAYRFMSYAQCLREEGPFINKKLNALRQYIIEHSENRELTDYDYQTIISFGNVPLYDKKTADIAAERFKKTLKIPFFLTKNRVFKELADFFKGFDEYPTEEYFYSIAGMKGNQ